MGENIAKIIYETIYKGNGAKEAGKDIDDINKKSKSANKEAKDLGNTLSTGIKTAGLLAASKFIMDTTSKIITATKKSADYVEALNLLDVAFNNDTRSIREFTSTFAETLNLDEKTLIDAAGHFKVLSQSMNMANETGEKFSKLLTQMTLDVSSLYNIDFDKAQTALQYAVEGRGTSLKQRTGVSVLETTVQTTLDTLGVDAYVEDMNDTEKALARVIAMTYQLRNSQGDLARTIEAPANQFRVLGEQISMVGRNIGNIFLPMVAAILPYVNAVLIVINKLLSALAKLFGFKETSWDSFEEGTTAFDDLGASVAGVGNAADSTKKKLLGLRGFDKLNVITTPTSGSGGSGGGGGAGGINPDLLNKFNELFGSYNSMLDGIETKATRIANAILKWIDNVTKFNIEANKIQLKSIGDSIENIKKSLSYIFSDKTLQESAQNFVDSVTNTLQKLVNNSITIGINLADGLISGFAQFLDSKKDDIIEDLTRTFDIGTAFNDALANLSDALATISIVFTKDNFKGIVESLYSIFYEAFANVYLLAAQLGTDIVNAIVTPISDNADKIADALDNTFGPLKTTLETIEGIITNLFDSIWSAYDSTIKPAMDEFTTFVSDNLGKILDAYNKYVAPVLDRISKEVKEVYDKYINPVVGDIIAIIGDIIAVVMKLYEQNLKPIIDWVTGTLLPILMPIIQTIADVASSAISNIWSGIKMLVGVLRGVIDFLTGVFTGNWDKAFGGIKEIIDSFKEHFEEKIEIIKSGFSKIIENIQNIFNGFVEGFKNKFEEIKNKISEGKEWFKNFKDNIEKAFKNIPNFFKEKFETARDKIKSAFSSIPTFFNELLGKITGKFSELGSKVGDTISRAFKTAINAVLKTAETVLNSPIRAINSLIGVINKLPGISLTKLNTFSLPRLAQGGLPDVGQMFIANERGPELVGQIGGQSFVANQNQMMDLLDKKISNAGGLQNATFVIQVGSEEVAKTVLHDLNSMAKSNGKPIVISG